MRGLGGKIEGRGGGDLGFFFGWNGMGVDSLSQGELLNRRKGEGGAVS